MSGRKKKLENTPSARGPESRTKYSVSPEEFVLTWNDAESADEVAERLNMPKPIVLARVSAYRKKGVNLKKMRRANRRLDVENLNKIVNVNKSFLSERNHPQLKTVDAPLVMVFTYEGVGSPRSRQGISLRVHLLDGTPDGLRIIERARSTVQALVCSRSRFRAVKLRPEFQKPGVYVLIGPPATDGRQPLYVGEGDVVLPRLEQHCCKKEFWTTFILFTAKTDCLHKAHVQYLESRLITLAKAGGTCRLLNGNTPQQPSLSAADTAEGEGFLDEVLLLSRLLGLACFEPAASDQQQATKSGPSGGPSEAQDKAGNSPAQSFGQGLV